MDQQPPPITSPSSVSAAKKMAIATAVLTSINVLCALAVLLRVGLSTMRNHARVRREEAAFVSTAIMGDVEKAAAQITRMRRDRPFSYYRWPWEFIPAEEVFPCVLSAILLLQGILLAAVEGQGAIEQNISLASCQTLVQVTWAAIWIAPYLTFVFAVEAAFRATCPPRYKPRSPWTTLYCHLVTLVFLILTWLPVRELQQNDQVKARCSETMLLLDHVDSFSAGATGLLVALVPLTGFMQFATWRGLSWREDLQKEQEMVESRELLFSMAQALQWILMLPNFIAVASTSRSSGLSFLAAASLNTSAVSMLILHLHLRARPETSIIQAAVQRIPIMNISAPTPVPYTEKRPVYTMEAFVEDQAAENKERTFPTHKRSMSDIINKPLPTSPARFTSRSNNTGYTPSRYSRNTLASFQRLGDEIAGRIQTLRQSGSYKSEMERLELSRQPTSSSTKTGRTTRTARTAGTGSDLGTERELSRYYSYYAHLQASDALGVPSPTLGVPPLPSPTPSDFPLPRGVPPSPTPSDFPLPRRTPTPSSCRSSASILGVPKIQVSSSPAGTLRGEEESAANGKDRFPVRPSRSAVPSVDMGRRKQHVRENSGFAFEGLAPPPSKDMASRTRFPIKVPPPAVIDVDAIAREPRSRTGSGTSAGSGIGLARSTSPACGDGLAVAVPRAPPVPIEISVPPGKLLAARKSEDAESFKEIPRWR